METLISFLIAAILTMFFVRRYLKKLSGGKSKKEPASDAPSPSAAKACPRCAASIPGNSAFCPLCGAPLAIWSSRGTAVDPAAAASAAKGKPRPVINASLCIGCGSCVDECPETGTLELAKGKAILAHPDRCVGHAKCVEVCPTQAILLSFGGVLQTMSVPFIKDNFETNVPGVFIVGELGGVGLIKTGINEGKLVVEHLKSRFGEMPVANGAAEAYDVIIVGTGPAGLSASLTAHQYGLRYLTLEQGEVAATIRHYPRQKLVFAEPIEMPLYGSLYMADGSKESLLAIWETIIANTGVTIQTNTRVDAVRRSGELLRVETTRGEYLGRTVVLATGKRGTPRQLGVPGEDLAKVAYRLIEAETYSNEDVLVVGGGDSAIENALALAKGGRNRVTLSYRGEAFNRAKERNQALLATAEGEGRLRVLRKSQVVEIRPQTVVLEHEGSRSELPNSYVFIQIGGESPDTFLRKIGIEIVEKSFSAAS
jgi:thioredoxin reductase (NADPH)